MTEHKIMTRLDLHISMTRESLGEQQWFRVEFSHADEVVDWFTTEMDLDWVAEYAGERLMDVLREEDHVERFKVSLTNL